jgi:thiosulfate dehydrogenase [quinone] large subunit
MLGLVGIGIGLCAGIAMRASSVAAAIMLVLMWSVVLPPANNPFMDDHLIYAIAILALPVLQAERMLGLGTWWKQTALVRRFPVLS